MNKAVLITALAAMADPSILLSDKSDSRRSIFRAPTKEDCEAVERIKATFPAKSKPPEDQHKKAKRVFSKRANVRNKFGRVLKPNTAQF